MQEEKLVLPKFTVPGQRNWVAWALAGVGGLVVVNLVVFGVVLLKNRGAQTPVASQPAQAAEAPLAASATPVPAPQPKAALAAAAVPTADVAKEEPAAAKPTKARRAHHAHGGNSKALARASGSSHTRSSGKPDAIDELLKKFK